MFFHFHDYPIMYQCILNVPLWNDWSKVTYSQVYGSPVLKAFHSKVSGGFLWQDLQSSYSFGKIQNVGHPELSKEIVSQEKDFIFQFHVYFSASIYIYIIYIYIYIYIYKYYIVHSIYNTYIYE